MKWLLIILVLWPLQLNAQVKVADEIISSAPSFTIRFEEGNNAITSDLELTDTLLAVNTALAIRDNIPSGLDSLRLLLLFFK